MKAILIDDERLAIEFLEQQIFKNSDIDVVDTFTSFDINTNRDLLSELDIVFLDIEMPEINGLQLAELILEVNPAIEIIFVTAFNEYAVQAFELNALDYLLKPIQSDRLRKTIARIDKDLTNKVAPTIDGETNLFVKLSEDLSFKTNDIESAQTVQWRTTKAKELFLYLLQNRETITPKSKLVDLLWPDFETEKAFSQLYTAIYHIRKVLEQFGQHFSLKSVQEGYMLYTHKVSVDIVEWENKLSTLDGVDENSITKYVEAMKLYTGPYLHVNGYTWADQEAFRLEQIWMKAAFEIANYYLKTENFEEAEAWFVKITAIRPEEEHAHFALMEIYASLGLGLLVDHQYTQLQKALAEIDMAISSRVMNWYEVWKASR